MGFDFKIWCNTVASCQVNLECLFIETLERLTFQATR
jgi:hypothetical protein